jgi:sortase A
VLGVVGRVLIFAGLTILGFVAFQLWGTGLEESRRQGELADDFGSTLADAGIEVAADADLAGLTDALDELDPATAPAPEPVEGEPIGIIEIPRIDLSRMMVVGTTRSDLKKGPGHYIGTPLPGQPGNVGIAGHRTTYGAPFNRIDELEPGDEVIVSTSQGRFTYRVIEGPQAPGQAWFTVKPTQTEVLDDMGDNRITLTACHPKYSARQRIIVTAVLQEPAAPAMAVEEPGEEAPEPEEFDEGLASTPDELRPAIAWAAAAAAVMVAAALVARRFRRRWPVYLLAAPVVLVLVWNAYIHMDRYLPAI